MKRKLARGAVWVTAARALINLVGLASTLSLARLLLPDDFGVVAIAMTFVAIVGSITELSLGSALIQHDAPSEAHYDTAFTLSAARAVIVSAVIAALAWPIAWLYGDPRVAPVLLVIAATSAIGGFGNPRMAIFTRRLEFWQDFVLGVSSKLIGFLVAVAVAYVFRSYWALVISNAVVQLQGVAMSYLLLRHRPRFNLTGWRDLMGFSIWYSLGQAINTLNWRSDSLLLGYFLGTRPLGYYSFGDNLASLPTREATSPIAQTLFPAFSRLTGEPDRLRAAYQRSQALLCAVSLPIGFGFALLAKPLVVLALGEKWLPAVIVIQVLSGVFAIQALATSVQPLALALGETKTLFRRDVLIFAMRVPMIVVGLAAGGLIGVVLARMVSGTVGTVINMGLVRGLIGLRIVDQVRANTRSLVATAAMVGVVAVAQGALSGVLGVGPFASMAILIGLGGAVYLGALFGLWMIAGRPLGPETELVEIVTQLRARFRQSGLRKAVW